MKRKKVMYPMMIKYLKEIGKQMNFMMNQKIEQNLKKMKIINLKIMT